MTEPIREAELGLAPAVYPHPPNTPEEIERRELNSIEEEFNDQALLIRTSVVNINARFAAGTEETDKERRKLEKFIRLMTQQHLKSLAQCVKLLIVGLMRNEIKRAQDGIMAHMGSLLAGQVALAEERGRIFRNEAEPVLVEVRPELLLPEQVPTGPQTATGGGPVEPLGMDPSLPVMDAAPEQSHTDAPADGTQA